jgi:integrase
MLSHDEKAEFEGWIKRRSHHDLMYILTTTRQALYHGRFAVKKAQKNEHVEHGMTLEEFRRFLAVVDDDEFRGIFTLIGLLGMRPNEIIRLRGRDVLGKRLLIPSSKGGYELDLELPDSLLRLIPAAGPGERVFLRRFAPKTALGKIGTMFRAYRERAGLFEIYGYSEPCGRNGEQVRPLNRFSVKSLRYTGGQLVKEITGDSDLSRRLWRHRDPKTSIRYERKRRKPELEKALCDVSALVVCEPSFSPVPESAPLDLGGCARGALRT